MESTGAGLASGTASRTAGVAGWHLVARARAERAAGVARWVPDVADDLEHLVAVGDQRGGAAADQLVDALGLGAGHRPGHAHQVAVEAGGPAGGVEGAAASGRLDHDGAAGQGGDQPVAAEEPTAGRGAPGRHLRDHRGRPAEMVEQVVVGGRVGAVGTAGEDGDVGAVDARARRGGRPGRCRTPPRTRPDGRPGPGRRRCRRRPRCRRSWPSASRPPRPRDPAGRAGSVPSPRGPSGGPPRWSSSSARIRSSSWVGHSSSPGTT